MANIMGQDRRIKIYWTKLLNLHCFCWIQVTDMQYVFQDLILVVIWYGEK